MAESEIALFDRIVNTAPPENPRLLFDTACVLGGSLAGLFAARVLAGHARQVVVIEQDEPGDGPRPAFRTARSCTPCWLPVDCDWTGGFSATRWFRQARVRENVLALSNVTLVQGCATGLEYRGGEVSAVHYTEGGTARVLPAGFVVDAMGRRPAGPDRRRHHDPGHQAAAARRAGGGRRTGGRRRDLLPGRERAPRFHRGGTFSRAPGERRGRGVRSTRRGRRA
jgi:2-polyprenyl-6-methoxyphenol hydroxylase-like FAD-dependent oxidoreductase